MPGSFQKLRNVILPAAAFLALLAFAGGAFAHAKLVGSRPSPDQVVTATPGTVELTFSVGVQPSMSSITVIAGDGTRYEFKDLTAADGNKVIAAALPALADGRYTVEWKALSADDHVIRGTFAFEVRAGGPAPASPETAAPAAPAEHDHSHMDHSMHQAPAGINWPQSLIRWLAYIAMLSLAGVFAFRVFVLRTALADRLGAAEKRMLPIALAAVVLLVAANLAALVLQSSTLFDSGLLASFDPAQLRRVITETTFGPPWAMQTAAAAAAFVIIILLRGDRRGEMLWWLGLAASAVILLAPSLTGHARAASGEYSLAIVSGWLHLAAAAVWVGGLVQIGLSLPAIAAAPAGSERLLAISAVVAGFNRAAIAATAVIAATGIYNTWIHVESPAALVTTEYGWVLIAKVALSLIMVALGGVNAFIIHPRIKEQARQQDAAASDAARPLMRNVRIEIGVAAAVLMLAAILAFLPPAREHPPESASAAARSENV